MMDWYAWASMGIALAYLFTTERYCRHPTARGVPGSSFDAHSSKLCLMWWSTCFTLPLIVTVPPVNVLLAMLPGGGGQTQQAIVADYPTFIRSLHIVVALAGTGLRYWAMHTLGQRFTSTLRTVDEHQVESGGPYAWIRHPGYAANGLAMLPFPILASVGRPIVPLVCVLMYLMVYLYRIYWEEKMLLHKLGQSYERYRRTTPSRLLPFIF